MLKLQKMFETGFFVFNPLERVALSVTLMDYFRLATLYIIIGTGTGSYLTHWATSLKREQSKKSPFKKLVGQYTITERIKCVAFAKKQNASFYSFYLKWQAGNVFLCFLYLYLLHC